jgi:hypothetical protein
MASAIALNGAITMPHRRAGRIREDVSKQLKLLQV